MIVLPQEEGGVIKILEGFPQGVIGAEARGRVTIEDYDKILIPAVEATLSKHGKVSLYYELGKGFSGIEAGAAWRDLRLGVAHFSAWERMALVTDIEWIRLAVNVFRFMMPAKLRIFSTVEADEARLWVGEGQGG